MTPAIDGFTLYGVFEHINKGSADNTLVPVRYFNHKESSETYSLYCKEKHPDKIFTILELSVVPTEKGFVRCV